MKHRVIAEGLQFPEGPAFDREGNLYVVEIAGGQLELLEDDKIDRGGCVVEDRSGTVDATVATATQAVRSLAHGHPESS